MQMVGDGFEVFDLAHVESAPLTPKVRVTEQGLLLNRAACDVFGVGTRSVQLLFDAEERLVQVRAAEMSAPSTSVFPVEAMRAGARYEGWAAERAMDWPALVRQSVFVERHRIAVGEYPATAEPGKVTFAVGPARAGAAPVDREPDGIGWPTDRAARS